VFAIEFPFEKNLLANRLSMKPESFSGALAKSRPYGVTIEKETIMLADPGRLRHFAGYTGEGEQEWRASQVASGSRIRGGQPAWPRFRVTPPGARNNAGLKKKRPN